MEWMILPLRKYAQFSGRSRRMEYWMFVLFVVVVSAILQAIEGVLGISERATASPIVGVGGNGPLSGIFGLVVLVPGIAVAVRRLHDINRSGWWILAPVGVALIVIGAAVAWIFQASTSGGGSTAGMFGSIGLLLLVYFAVLIGWIITMCLPGTKGPNRYGPDPKNPDGDLESVFS